MGAVVVADVAPGRTVVGVPARQAATGDDGADD
jgi:serine acetyltransferase